MRLYFLHFKLDKLIKHYCKCNWIYCISLILDPKHKVEGFDATTWGKNLKDCSISKFEYVYKNNYYLESPNNALNKIDQNILKY